MKLVLGKDILNERSNKIGAIQIPGAGSGLRIAGELIKTKLKNKLISIPNPTWGQQTFMFQKSGLKITKHRYYDNTNNFLNFEDDVILNFYNHEIVKNEIDKNKISKIFKKFKL